MQKEVIIAIIGALAVIGGAVIQSGILSGIGGGAKLPVIKSFEPDNPSPQETGTAITWNAMAEDSDSIRLFYKFSAKNSSADEWVIGKNWSTQNKWVWTPSEAGSYDVRVEVRDGDHAGSEGRDDSWNMSYVIEERAVSDEAEISEEPSDLESLQPDKTSPHEGAVSEESERSREPPDLKSLEPDKPSPQETGTVIKWTAMAEDPDSETISYRFLLMGPSTGGSWNVVQDWSPQSRWDWTPSEAGSYNVKLEARYEDEGGSDGKYPSLPVEDYHILVAVSEEDPAVAVSSWGEGRLDLFVRGKDGALYHRYGDGVTGVTWSNWTSLGGNWTSAPAAVSRGPNTIDVFAIGEDNDLMHKRLEGLTWSNWTSLGGNWTSAPAASSRGEDRLDVFVRGRDNAIWHKWWNGSFDWNDDWVSLEGEWTSAPAAVNWVPYAIRVYAKGKDNDLWEKCLDGSTWSNWKSLGGEWTSAPAAAALLWDKSSLNVYGRGTENKLWEMHYSQKSGWQSKKLDGFLTSAPAAVSWGPNRIDIFYKGTENTLMHKWYDGSWKEPISVGTWPPE